MREERAELFNVRTNEPIRDDRKPSLVDGTPT
jgi:hypothetical protein